MKNTALEKELEAVRRKEERYLKKRAEKKVSALSRALEQKAPEKLQDILNAAFSRAFSLVFQKGTAVIEKTCPGEKIKKEVMVREYAAEIRGDRRSLREFSNQAAKGKRKSMLVSGAGGIGLGIFGVGLPDIPLFTAVLLRSIYETGMQFGYFGKTEKEQRFILLLIQGALSYGDEFIAVNEKVDAYSENSILPEEPFASQMDAAAAALARELLCMKFLQGIPVAGAVGGAYDAVCLKKIMDYVQLKYRKRFLTDRKRLTAKEARAES